MSNDRAITIGGILFTALAVAGLTLLLPAVAGGDTSNASVAEWTEDSGNRIRAIAGAYLLYGAAFGFALLALGIAGRLRTASAPPMLIEIARFSGIAFVVIQLVAVTAMASASMAVAFENEPRPVDPGALRITTYGLSLWLIPGMLSGSVFVGSVAVAVLKTHTLPAWVGLTGLLCAAVLLAGVTFLPIMVFFLWTVCTSLVVLVRGERAPPLRASAIST